MHLALLLTSALALVVAAQDDVTATTTSTSKRRTSSPLDSSTITGLPTASDTYRVVLPTTTSTAPASNDPTPGYSVNNTAVTYPTSKDWCELRSVK